MQCPACRAVYSNGLDLCPRCKTVAPRSSRRVTPEATPPQDHADVQPNTQAAVAEETGAVSGAAVATATANAPTSSTLIEFPGAGRAALPQWRKDLSDRVREIQERRAREAARDAEEAERRRREQPPPELTPAPQLGLVPPPDAPPVNPIVAAALKRLERARQQPTPPMPRTRGGAAVAVARVAEEQYQESAQPEMVTRPALAPPLVAPSKETEKTVSSPKPAELAREHGLSVVIAPSLPQEEPPPARTRYERLVASVADQELLTESTALETEESGQFLIEDLYDDRASLGARFAGGLIDLLVVAFASSPFAAIIELTNGNWMDLRVSASMGGITLVVMFLYLAASTAMTGRTWGMSLVSLRAVDADTGLLPTTRQAVVRALCYMLSLAAFGLGVLYALFDAEGRTAYDHFSGTAVVRE